MSKKEHDRFIRARYGAVDIDVVCRRYAKYRQKMAQQLREAREAEKQEPRDPLSLSGPLQPGAGGKKPSLDQYDSFPAFYGSSKDCAAW